jgi:sigma-B regulation protein RsbU (phosphoserine phosphatase)
VAGPAVAAEVVPLERAADGIDTELRLAVPSSVAHVEAVVDVVTRHCEARFADPRAVRFNLRVALAEVLANAILYGNRSEPERVVRVRVRTGRHLIEVDVEDEGEGFDPESVPDPTAPERLHEPGGRGVYLVRRLMDEVHFSARGNAVHMFLRRASAPAPRSGRLEPVLDALALLVHAPLRVWRREGGRTLQSGGPPGAAPVLEAIGPRPGGYAAAESWLEPVPDAGGVWIQVGPGADDVATRPMRARLAAAVVADVLKGEREASLVAAELATRYEEIDLLYTIADLLGRTLKVEEAAQVIVRELADVVGARRASIMVYDEAIDALRLVAGRGLETYQVDPVPVQDPRSIAARVFREQEMLAHDGSLPGSHPGSGEPRGYKGSSFVSLPITYQPPGGAPRQVGVINLTDRIGGDSFTAGHRKLLAAVANQVGAAIENARLVERERRRVRLDTEMLLAQGLQAALMQSPMMLAQVGDIAARTRSAEVVGGDFYKVVPLRPETLGVMLGDVSSHGLSAAMLMAHATAAAAILAQTARSAEQALERLLGVIGDELARAEMHLAIFYGIVDRKRGTLRFANAGHPQSFVVPADGGSAYRLAATAPPLGLGQEPRVKGGRATMRPGDLLCLFSDGLTESAPAEGAAPYGEERLLDCIRRHRSAPAEDIVAAVFAEVESYAGVIGRDDRTLLVLRR